MELQIFRDLPLTNFLCSLELKGGNLQRRHLQESRGMWVHKTVWPLCFSSNLLSADQEEFLLIQCTLGVWHLVV